MKIAVRGLRKGNSLLMYSLLGVSCVSAFVPESASAQTAQNAGIGCDAYPYQPSDTVIEFGEAGQFKILTTAAASVDFDDVSSMQESRREAELIAKRTLAEYINQQLSSEDKIERQLDSAKSLVKNEDGTTVVTAQRQEAKTMLTTINARADVVLRGVVVLGSCYTKGNEVRVTVGIKSETVANAQVLGQTMDAVAATNYGKTSPAASLTDGEALNGSGTPQEGSTRDYTGGDRIKDFMKNQSPTQPDSVTKPKP
jgi:hypothetical protein